MCAQNPYPRTLHPQGTWIPKHGYMFKWLFLPLLECWSMCKNLYRKKSYFFTYPTVTMQPCVVITTFIFDVWPLYEVRMQTLFYKFGLWIETYSIIEKAGCYMLYANNPHDQCIKGFPLLEYSYKKTVSISNSAVLPLFFFSCKIHF